jgi:signal transduction histidine kinase
MSLRRKVIANDVGLLLSLSLMIGGSLWGLARQRAHVRASLAEYAALQRVEAGEVRFLAYRQTARPDDLAAALLELRRYKAIVAQYDTGLPPEITPELQASARSKTKVLLAGLSHLTAAAPPPRASPDELSADFADLLAVCTGFLHRTNVASTDDLRLAVIGVSTVAGVTVVVAVAVSVWQYRRVMVPLDRLRHWCRRTAGGDFSAAYEPTADREFQDLGRDVNRMAEDLAAFYRRLEERVAARGRQLALSERLASVGYLAAGVAHEINTPLNVMSGYAELSIKRLRRAPPGDDADPGPDVVRQLEIIRAEAFRCKEITQKLLSLARGTGEARQAVSAAAAVRDVASLVRGLPASRRKRIEVARTDDPCEVHANPTELRQVLLNLVVNALEAIGDAAGTVNVTVERDGGRITIRVVDDGRGMTAETLDRAFEPFFTHKRGAGNAGTGLGLSITHAIVADHDGEITAHSDGPGRGSTFTVRLPAAGGPASARRDAAVEAVT